MKTLKHTVGAVLVMLAGASGLAHAGESIVPDFLPRGAVGFSDEQLSFIKKHERVDCESLARWEDIKGWRALGTRWAVALDARGQALALYDLSLPEGILPGFGIELGRIGGPDFTFKHARELIERARHLTQDKKGRQALDEALARIDGDKVKKGHPLLGDDWYKSVPWTRKALSSMGVASIDAMAAPQAFTLADIDFKKVTISPELFDKSVRYLGRFGVSLSRLELVRQTDGSYAMRVKADPQALDGSILPKPAKLADTHDVLEGFWWSVERQTAKMVLGFAINQIPNPTVAAVVGTVLDRYLTLRFDVYNYHREAAAEMVEAAYKGETPYSSFAALTPAELQGLGTSMYLAQLRLSSIWSWITRGNGEKAWKADMDSNVKNAASAHEYLSHHGYALMELNARYALSTTPGHHKLYMTGRWRMFGKNQEPLVAIDYDHPLTQTAINEAMEVATTIVHFSGHLIPTVGSAVPVVWDWVVRDQIQGIKYGEARLMAHLEDRELVSSERWDNELSTLLLQQANPFDLMPEQSRDYVAKVAESMHLDRSGVARRVP